MVEQGNATSTTTSDGGAPDLGWHPLGAEPRDPGWYPTGTNPNEQAYWDGQGWTGTRNWTVNGWVEDGTAPKRRSANPYAPLAANRRGAPATLNMGLLLLMVSGIALMFGSVGSWIHLSGSVGILTYHTSLNGTDQGISQLIGVNGYVTFIAGVVLLVFGGLALTNDDLVLAVVTFAAAAATLIFAIYDMFRIVQKITQVHPVAGASLSVGAGLICVLSAAALAIIVTSVRLLHR